MPDRNPKGDLDLLISRLQAIRDVCNKGKYMGPDETHFNCDLAILEYIGDERITALHEELCPYYA